MWWAIHFSFREVTNHPLFTTCQISNVERFHDILLAWPFFWIYSLITCKQHHKLIGLNKNGFSSTSALVIIILMLGSLLSNFDTFPKNGWANCPLKTAFPAIFSFPHFGRKIYAAFKNYDYLFAERNRKKYSRQLFLYFFDPSWHEFEI